MRICGVSHHGDLGGTGHSLLDLATADRARGNEAVGKVEPFGEASLRSAVRAPIESQDSAPCQGSPRTLTL